MHRLAVLQNCPPWTIIFGTVAKERKKNWLLKFGHVPKLYLDNSESMSDVFKSEARQGQGIL